MTDVAGPLPRSERRTRLLLFGAGECGRLVAREIARHPELNYELAAVVDDSPEAAGREVEGVPVEDRAGAEALAGGYDQVLVAIPSASPEELASITEWCMELGVPVRIIPGYYQLIDPGRVFPRAAREVRLEDLLGRRPRRIDLDALRRVFGGASVLVTGAGGSIGSELCRQLAQLEPSWLGLLDVSEPGLFYTDLDLRDMGFDRSEVLLGDACDRGFLGRLMRAGRPDVVFHAAAYKHVPMLESNVTRAVLNNVLSTMALLDTSAAAGVSRFVMVSTDKAVRPRSVMGATKRVCELLVRSGTWADDGIGTRATVRFGNVLGSSGSLLPLIERQLGSGGPVTVTDRRMRRFFMSVPEAASLVLHVGARGEDGGVYVLDMGEPHDVYGVVEKMVRLSGMVPGKDVEIVETGARPGEKLFEELSWSGGDLGPTDHPSIMADMRDPPPPEGFREAVDGLLGLAGAGKEEETRRRLAEMFPSMEEG